MHSVLALARFGGFSSPVWSIFITTADLWALHTPPEHLLICVVAARDHIIKVKAGSVTDKSQFWKSAALCFYLSFSHFICIFHTGLALQAKAPSGHFQGYNQWGKHYVRWRVREHIIRYINIVFSIDFIYIPLLMYYIKAMLVMMTGLYALAKNPCFFK